MKKDWRQRGRGSADRDVETETGNTPRSCILCILLIPGFWSSWTVAGYVPDTDSEAGTLTTNSPTDWTEKQLHANFAATNSDSRQKTSASVKSKQSLIGRGDVCWDNSSQRILVYFSFVQSLPVGSCTCTNTSFTRMLCLSVLPITFTCNVFDRRLENLFVGNVLRP